MAIARKIPPKLKPKTRHYDYSQVVSPNLDKIACWFQMGHTQEQIADALGITRGTFCAWCKTHPELGILLSYKQIADDRVEQALYSRAVGYESTEVHYEEGTLGHKTKTITRKVEHNVTAQIYWLKNRRPDRWREQSQVEQTGELKLVFDADDEKV